MKIRADENVAPAIVDIVRELALSDGFELTSVIQIGAAGSADVHWITKFQQDGGDAILTADTDFHRQAPHVEAIGRLGLKVIHLPNKWSMAPGRLQASHLLLWWPRIERQLSVMGTRQCYSPQWNIKEDGELRQVPMDFAAAEKKMKKAARREAS